MKYFLVLLMLCSVFFIVSGYASTNVRCYFPGYSEVFKNVQYHQNGPIGVFNITVGEKHYLLPINACVVEGDL